MDWITALAAFAWIAGVLCWVSLVAWWVEFTMDLDFHGAIVLLGVIVLVGVPISVVAGLL